MSRTEAEMQGTAKQPPFRKITWLPRDIAVEHRSDGVLVLRSRIPLQPYARHLPAFLERWAIERPNRIWLAQRRGAQRQWYKLSYTHAKRTVDALTQALLDLNLDADRPLAILSGNSIEQGLMTMASMQARLAAAPISPAYSLLSQDHAKLKTIFRLIRPGVIFVQDGVAFDHALAALDLEGVTVVHVDRPPLGCRSLAFVDLANTTVTSAVAETVAAIEPDTVGKLLFTSGSTGMPKAVINTQRMMCANLAMVQQARPSGPNDPPQVLLDWMPWSHTMGGNAAFNLLLAEGGTLYIDEGRPQPGLFDETLRNLNEISPTYFANVPAGFAMLVTALERDDELCRKFFGNLRLLAYGGARLPDDLYDRMQKLAIRTTRERIVFYTGWGSTETAPVATGTYWDTERVGLIGLPFPGVELKMVPSGAKYELRLRGITVTSGYYRSPELTASAFDEEGFYKIGDAGVFVDPAQPAEGLIFAGRVAEDFKLTTGTFVHVGSLRVAALAAASPILQDALVTGQDRPYVGLLGWPNLEGCRQMLGRPLVTLEDLVEDPMLLGHLRERLRAHNKTVGMASSMRIERVLLMSDPPSMDGNELTDKGYINQRAGLERRAAYVERLYRDPIPSSVIAVGRDPHD
jgi:feruloyl-CoA synthase